MVQGSKLWYDYIIIVRYGNADLSCQILFRKSEKWWRNARENSYFFVDLWPREGGISERGRDVHMRERQTTW